MRSSAIAFEGCSPCARDQDARHVPVDPVRAVSDRIRDDGRSIAAADRQVGPAWCARSRVLCAARVRAATARASRATHVSDLAGKRGAGRYTAAFPFSEGVGGPTTAEVEWAATV